MDPPLLPSLPSKNLITPTVSTQDGGLLLTTSWNPTKAPMGLAAYLDLDAFWQF